MNEENTLQPLVSIVIVTYNSSKTVIETLESAKNQTYRNIELIVSDDCSSDGTVEVCKAWIELNNSSFIGTKLICSEKNSGIPSNFNRGAKASNGEWIKFIAGDDILLGNCISDYMTYIKESQESVFAIHANMNVYNDTFATENLAQIVDYSKGLFNRNGITANQQYCLLLRFVFIGAPTFFVKRDLLLEMGGYDEQMPYEDWPFFINITKHGYKIHFLNKTTVKYRVHASSIYNKKSSKRVLYNNFFLKDQVVYKKYRKEALFFIERIIEDLEFKRKSVFIKFGLNKVNLINKLLNDFFNFLFFFSKRASFFFINKFQKLL